MTLLLVGIVAVILVILVAAFLTFRRGQDDDQDEPGGRWTVRDRVRSAGRDGHWRSSARERRPAEELRAPGRPGRPEPSRRPDDRQRGYDNPEPAYADRRPGRGQRDQAGGRGYPARPAGRYADTPAAADYPASRTSRTPPAGPPARGPGARRQPSGYDTGGYDNAGYDTAQYDSGPGGQLYDTGPSAVMDDQSRPGAHDFIPERDDDPALTDSDVFPRIRDDIPPETPRKAGKPHTAAKSRSKQSRSKRGDDDDWPSTEWDKLSDEQYWAELSADKPLATTARAAQPVAAKAAPAPPTPSQAKPAQARPAAAKPSRPTPPPPAPPAPASAKPTPDRASVAPRRRDRQQEAATEALPVRGRQRPTAPAPAPSLAREAGGPSLAALTSLANAPAARRPESAPRDDDPLTSPSFSRQGSPAQDSRSYRNADRDRPRGSTGDYPTGGHPSGGYANGAYANGGYANGGYSNGGYSNGNGAQGYQASDGEHTNPQAAYPAAWPGEQRQAPRPAPRPAAPRPAAPSAPSRAPAGNPYGSYVDSTPAAPTGGPTAGYPQDRARADVGYGSYPPAAGGGYPEPPFRPPAGPDPAMAGPPGRSDGWHSAPPPAAADFPTDPASQYLYTGGSGYPDATGYAAGPPADAGYQADYPQAPGYPEPASYPDGAYNGGGYDDGYGTDPYGPDGYGGYRPRQA
jgi:hypothetical protein